MESSESPIRPEQGPTAKGRRLACLSRQIDRLDRRLAAMERLAGRLSWLRVTVFVAGLIAVVAIYFAVGSGAFWLGLAIWLGLFGAVIAYHRRLERSLHRHAVLRRIKQTHVARARLDWPALPPAAPWTPAGDHPFERDLDLAGPVSVHRLLDTAVTRAGSTRLYDWLTATAPSLATIRQRQALVRELIPRTLFRDKLALSATAAAMGAHHWDVHRLQTWLEQGSVAARRKPWLIGLSLLAAANWLLFALDWAGVAGPYWQATLILYAALYLVGGRGAGALFGEAAALQDAVRQLQAVFAHLERHSYAGAPHLRELCAPFTDPERRPSHDLARISRVVAATGIQGNPLVALALNLLVPWNLYFAYRLDQVKAAAAHHIPEWTERWFDLEALCALATLGYLNPHYAFPVIEPAAADLPVFVIEQAGHPLIPDDAKVRNDFTFDRMGRVALITGSNMAGKSTFLRTVAVNLVLAHAGAPVDARRLAARHFRLFTSMAVSDSIAEGVSFFYAEVTRLRRLLGELETPADRPVFFCIDEIFRGTNNRERLLGSQAYVQALVGKAGVGLISTHDLELVSLADALPDVGNHHFRDAIVAGRMTFDYTLHPGPCPTTNALIIMREAGLPVPDLDAVKPAAGAGG